MSNVIKGSWDDRAGGGGHTGGTPPTGDNGLEKRVEALEKSIPDIRERLARVETKIDHIEKTMSTKTDMAELKASIADGFNSQTNWFIGAAMALAVLAFTAARFIPGGGLPPT